MVTRTEAAVTDLQGNGKLDALILKDGTRIEGDIFVACAGVVARTGLANQCGLDVGRGIKVDAFMRTSDPAIYAVGDAAELPGAIGGLWPVAGGPCGGGGFGHAGAAGWLCVPPSSRPAEVRRD